MTLNKIDPLNRSYTAFKAKIYGRVQGIGFRYATRFKAVSLDIKGWVRNSFDGTVEVECEGSISSIHNFQTWLKHGPSGAYVTKIEITEIPFKGIYNDFSITY